MDRHLTVKYGKVVAAIMAYPTSVKAQSGKIMSDGFVIRLKFPSENDVESFSLSFRADPELYFLSDRNLLIIYAGNAKPR
jgi:hypothetical protein